MLYIRMADGTMYTSVGTALSLVDMHAAMENPETTRTVVIRNGQGRQWILATRHVAAVSYSEDHDGSDND